MVSKLLGSNYNPNANFIHKRTLTSRSGKIIFMEQDRRLTLNKSMYGQHKYPELVSCWNECMEYTWSAVSSVVECRTHNRESPGSNPPLLPFRRLGIFVLFTDAPVHSAV